MELKTAYTAAKKGDLDTVKRYVEEGHDVNSIIQNGYTLLMAAAARNEIDVVRYLLENGANINAQDDDGYCALLYACHSVAYSECVQLLVDAGANVDLKNEGGVNALLLSTLLTNNTICGILIKAGADVNVVDNDGLSTIYRTLAYGQKETTKLLLDNGVFLFRQCGHTETVLDFAKYCYHGLDDEDNIVKLIEKLMTPERELTEHILLNQNIENEVFNSVRIEKMLTINPYYILSDAETNIPIGTFTPSKALNGLEIYDGFETLDEAIDNVYNPIDTEVVDNII